jgi:hypothetical protein
MIDYGCVSLCNRVLAIAKGTLAFPSFVVLIILLSAEANAGPNEDILAATKAGNRTGVEAALAAGASVNAVDERGLSPLGLSGFTPLGLAAAYGHRNVAEFLLDRGANVDATDSLKHTPLQMAAEYGNADVAALLLDHGADVDARDIAGATPLEWAALRGNKKVVLLLINRGALVNAQASTGKTALHLAATAGHKEIVAVLLAHGADVRIKNSDGQTPLQEMQVSPLDPATKAKIAVMLGPKQVRKPVTAPVPLQPSGSLTVAPMPPQSSSSVTPNGLPACTDVAGIARVVIQANPGAPPAVIARAVDQIQIAMGCRAPPLKTRCSWIGDVWTCTTQ